VQTAAVYVKHFVLLCNSAV